MIVTVSELFRNRMARGRRAVAPSVGLGGGLTMGEVAKRLGSIARVACIATVAATVAASAQQRKPATAIRPSDGVSHHDPQWARDMRDMGAVALADGPSNRQGGRRILGGGLPVRSRRRQPPRRDRAVSPRRTCRLARQLLHGKPADPTACRSQCPGAPNACSSRRTAMMAMIESIGIRKLVLLAVALALALSMMGCAATGSGPLSSHGVDYAPSFNPE